MTTKQIRHSNRTVVDIRKVAYCHFYYRSGEYEKALKPKHPSVRGEEMEDPDFYAYPHKDYPKETILERAIRLDILDKWIPVCVLITTSGHRIEFTGDKAVKIKDAYNAYIFKEQKKRNK